MRSRVFARKMALLLLAAVLSLQLCQSAGIPRSYDSQRLAGPSDEVVMLPKKRPFCNAFTGCGRKRSSSPGYPMPIPELLRQRQLNDEDLGSLLDLSSEPVVEDLSRQILSEAKLWEAIQEASAEIYRRKQGGSNYPVAYIAQ